MKTFITLVILALMLPLVGSEAGTDATGKRVVLIGGKKSHGPGEHDFATGLGVIKQALLSIRNVHGLSVDIHPDAWPVDGQALAGASTVVWYFDGIQEVPHPLLNPDRRAAFAKLMAQGVGLVCLHQATSLPEDNTSIPLTDWLGACRYGMIDRANEMCDYTQQHADSAVCRGWASFSYKDEIYPTLRFVPELKGVTPLITAIAPPEKPAEHTVAWTYERSGGGRSFGFTGLHYVTSMRVEPVRRMVLNGILWTAHIEIPAGGADSPVLPPAK
jgi:hypothetical protein